jgi:UDP-N-acetyl-D-mannosaminuronate dehydrogenase
MQVNVDLQTDFRLCRFHRTFVLAWHRQARGTAVDYYDPYVPMIPKTREHAGLAGMRSVSIDPPTVASYDAVLIITDHSEIDWQELVDAAQLVVDTRNATVKVTGDKEKVFLRDVHYLERSTAELSRL